MLQRSKLVCVKRLLSRVATGNVRMRQLRPVVMQKPVWVVRYASRVTQDGHWSWWRAAVSASRTARDLVRIAQI